MNDNHSAIKDNAQLSSDLRTITGSKYGSMRKLAELQALLVVAETLSIQIAEAKPARPNDRALALIARTLSMHLVKIRARINIVTKMNESKASKQRKERERLQLFDALSQSGVIPALVQQARITRSVDNTQSREIAAAQIAASVPVIRRQLEESGLPIHGTLEEREEWAKNRPPIPGVDLQEEHNRVMKELENITNTYGSPADWIK